MSDREPLIPTPSQTIGPFFEFAMTPRQSLRTVGPLDGEAIRLAIVITDGDGRPVGDSLVELWQSAGDTQPASFGRMPTGPDGRG